MPYVNLCDFSALRIHIFLECMGRKSLLKIDLLGNENLFQFFFISLWIRNGALGLARRHRLKIERRHNARERTFHTTAIISYLFWINKMNTKDKGNELHMGKKRKRSWSFINLDNDLMSCHVMSCICTYHSGLEECLSFIRYSSILKISIFWQIPPSKRLTFFNLLEASNGSV